MSRTISLSEAIEIVHRKDAGGRKVPFSMRFVTLSKTRKKQPSRHMYVAKAEICGAAHDLARHSQIGIRPLGRDEHQLAVHVRLITHVNELLVR